MISMKNDLNMAGKVKFLDDWKMENNMRESEIEKIRF